MSRFKTAPVAATEGEWIERRRKGAYVRYQHSVSALWSKWTRDPSKPFYTAERAVANTLEFIAETMGKMTVAELRALAGNKGVKVPSKARKADIISALTN